jgi:hypothetical protein
MLRQRYARKCWIYPHVLHLSINKKSRHRTATTPYPCYLPVLGEFRGSWSCRQCKGNVLSELYYRLNSDSHGFRKVNACLLPDPVLLIDAQFRSYLNEVGSAAQLREFKRAFVFCLSSMYKLTHGIVYEYLKFLFLLVI